MVVGLRGFPDIQGGIETHAEHLYPELVKLGCDVEVIVRSPYVKEAEYMYCGVRLKAIWSPVATGMEALLHSFLAVCYVGLKRPDVLHIHAVGPSLFVPLARMFGLRVVMTHHGMDYQRQKWGVFASFVLRLGERLGANYAHACITVSESIQQFLQEQYGTSLKIRAIHNGVEIPKSCDDTAILEKFDLQKKKYFLMVSRFVPEKRQDDLIEAFLVSKQCNKRKLVLVGDYHKASKKYLEKIQALAAQHANIVLTGFQTGDPLASLYTHAEAFFLPSSHEGLPIALLEALSYGLYAVVSDIPAHIEMNLEPKHYFRLGNIAALAECMDNIPQGGLSLVEREKMISSIQERFDWSIIAQKTLQVLKGPS